MKHNFKNIIAFIIVMSVVFSVVAIPVRAEAGISEAVREGDDLGIFGVFLSAFVVVGTIILFPILLVLSLMFGEEAATDMLHNALGNLIS
ncbi:MAG: hypothetical protein J6S23_06625 [Clostridia bacterium]|nr:hypothetical protein [Clostridia bacterium]